MSASKPKSNDVALDTMGLPLPVPPEISSGRLSKEFVVAKSVTNGHGQVVFVEPMEGTPAAAALAANAQLKVSKTDKFLSKLRGMKRPKLKSLNLVKQLNKHTKARRKAHKNFKGKVIDGQHELYVITAGIVLGIKCSLNHAQELEGEDDVLALDSFNYVEKASFPAAGSDEPPYPTPPHSLVRTFKFKTYAPRVFARLRGLIDIDPNEYMESICGNYNFLEFMSNSKSGQFFFYSHDGKYMLKTQTKEENRFMKCILPHYYRYLAENPHSLLVRILGMHRIKMYQFRRKVHFVIMTSVFDTPEQIHTIYDLKGSLVGRAATAKEKANGGVLKDRDLLESGEKIKLGDKKKAFLAQLDKDAKFLATLGIMDYSLLLGVHYRDRRPPLEPDATSDLPTAAGEHTESAHGHGHAHPHSHSDTPLRRAQHAVLEQNAALVNAPRLGAPATVPEEDVLVSAQPEAATTSLGSGVLYSELIQQGDRASGAPFLTPVRHGPSGSHVAHAGEQADGASPRPPHDNADEADGYYDDSDDSDTQSIQLDAQENGANDVLSAASLLLRKEIAYSDSYGLKCPEGNRLSLILSPRVNSPVPPLNAPTRESSVDNGSKRSSARGGEELSIAMQNLNQDQSREHGTSHSTEQLAFGHHPWTARADGGINSHLADGRRGNEIYYCGVIDILQKYNFRKQSESILKGFFQDTNKISAVNPDRYAKRFTQFMMDNIE